IGQVVYSAFRLFLMYVHAEAAGHPPLLHAIKTISIRVIEADQNCNLAYEHSGYDFLSSCLEEAYLMSKIMQKAEYKKWLLNFLPILFEEKIESLQPALVSDRTDGKLVHLDGLNFKIGRAHV